MTRSTFRILGPAGIIERAALALAERARARREHRTTGAEDVPVRDIMTRSIVCAHPDLPVAALLGVMIGERLGCVPVVNEDDQPIGMVTKLDVVEHLVASPPPPDALVRDLMMPLAITLDDDASVAHAATLMAGEDMHHVMIVSGRRLVGIVSTMDVTRWIAEHGKPA